MLKSRKLRVGLIVGLTIAVLGLIDRASLLIAPCGPGGGSRGGEQGYKNDDCATREGIVVAGVKWLGNNPPEFWTAVSSLLIAIFTGTLWFSTDKLWRAGEKQIRMMRGASLRQSVDAEEQVAIAKESADAAKSAAEAAVEGNRITREIFVAEQRPWLLWHIPQIQTMTTAGNRIEIRIDGQLENIGRVPALNVVYFGKLYFRRTSTESLDAQGRTFYAEHLQQALGYQFWLTSVLPTEKSPLRFGPHGIPIADLPTGAFPLCLAFHAKYELGQSGQIAEIGTIYMVQPHEEQRRAIRGTTFEASSDFQGKPITVVLVELPGARRIT